MKLRNILLAACIFIILALIYMKIANQEMFESRREKAEAISNWFNKNGGKESYVKFRKDLPDVDVVDYEKIKALPSKAPEHIEPQLV